MLTQIVIIARLAIHYQILTAVDTAKEVTIDTIIYSKHHHKFPHLPPQQTRTQQHTTRELRPWLGI